VLRPLLARRPGRRTVILVLLTALITLAAVAALRGPEYDEGYTVFVTAGTPRPAWPSVPFRAGAVRHYFRGGAAPGRIVTLLRRTDVHPPLYFWLAAAWRRMVGFGLLRLRLLSVLLSLLALGAVGAIAAEAGLPPAAAMALTLGCYGFAYTGAVARGFALAQALSVGGVWLLLRAARRDRAWSALAGGLALGAAGFSNYLAVFVGCAALLWLFAAELRRPALWLAAGVGFLLFLPGDFFFFLAQRDSRIGQFAPFATGPAVARLARDAAAAILGGLPLYLSGVGRVAAEMVLAFGLVALVLLIAGRWRHIGMRGTRTLFAMAALAPPAGLVVLGLVFDTRPFEIRYLAFALPFLALLAAGAFAATRGGGKWLGLMLAVQAAAVAGLAVMPQTMQPQGVTARAAAARAGPDGLVLLPRGNDGVGVVGAFITAAPDWLHVLIVRDTTAEAAIRARAAPYPRVILAMLGVDASSRATLPHLLGAFQGARCWRQADRESHIIVFIRTCRTHQGSAVHHGAFTHF